MDSSHGPRPPPHHPRHLEFFSGVVVEGRPLPNAVKYYPHSGIAGLTSQQARVFRHVGHLDCLKARRSLAFHLNTSVTRLTPSVYSTMLGAFRPTLPSLGGLLWKNPWRLSSTRKNRVRQRLRAVDNVIATLEQSSVQCNSLSHAIASIKPESQMSPNDKYTTFSKHDRGFRKSVHKVPKWTRKTIRENPVGY